MRILPPSLPAHGGGVHKNRSKLRICTTHKLPSDFFVPLMSWPTVPKPLASHILVSDSVLKYPYGDRSMTTVTLALGSLKDFPRGSTIRVESLTPSCLQS